MLYPSMQMTQILLSPRPSLRARTLHLLVRPQWYPYHPLDSPRLPQNFLHHLPEEEHPRMRMPSRRRRRFKNCGQVRAGTRRD